MVDVEAIVRKLVRTCETIDPIAIARSLDIQVIFMNLGGLAGFYMMFNRQKTIIIDRDACGKWIKYVAAHELGHALLTPHQRAWFSMKALCDRCYKEESIANTFAVELLLAYSDKDELRGRSIYDIADQYGIPRKYIELKRSWHR